MEFITIKPNRSPLAELSRKAIDRCTRIDAAVAYISDDRTLITSAIDKKIPLCIYGRYDYSGPVRSHILRKFIDGLDPKAFSLRLVADVFHPKTIWWHGFGVYIGSANLTDRAWFTNIEAGVFITEEEIYEDGGIAEDLEGFFDLVHERSHALTHEIVDHIENLENTSLHEVQKKTEDLFESNRIIPRLPGFHEINRSRWVDRARSSFIKEWDETLEIMRDIGKLVSLEENRPKWISVNTPVGVQADQFLHAYYYKKVTGDIANSHPFADFFHQNKNRKAEALKEVLFWWKNLPGAVAEEDIHINEWAPFVRSHLSADKLLGLNSEELYETCQKIHALAEHAKRIQWQNHGIYMAPGTTQKARIKQLSDWLLEQKNRKGETTLQVIHYVLYGGDDSQLAKRIFEASNDPERKIPHLGVSTYGEMVGWALPDRFPPRNGRTSKALTALGYVVKIHSQ